MNKKEIEDELFKKALEDDVIYLDENTGKYCFRGNPDHLTIEWIK